MDKELNDAIAKIQAAARAAGKKCAAFSSGGQQAKSLADAGFDMISVAVDVTVFQGAVIETMSLARGESTNGTGGY